MGESADLQSAFRVATLLQQRNAVDAEIASIIGRPTEMGHVGEYLASLFFDIELNRSAVQAGHDGRFRAGPLAGKSVNVKWYAKHENVLDINLAHVPDHYLVLTGPSATTATSRGTSRPWLMQQAFLFEAAPLIARLRARGVEINVATSVTRDEWNRARVLPGEFHPNFRLSEDAARLWRMLGGDSGARDTGR